MSKNNVNPYELDFLAESIHTIPTTTFKSNTIQIYNTTFTFESIITKANVPVGKGVTVYIYHKGLGTLLSKTETDEESKVYVPNLSKHNEYMVVAVDPKDIYNSVIFDINFDLSSKLNNNVTLKYYSIYDVPNLQQLYSYWDTTTDQRIDPSVLFFISNPNFKDDLGISWGMTGTVRSTTIEGARAFTFSNSGENIYVYHNPVPPKSAFTFSAYIYVDSNNRNTTTNNNIFKHHTQSLYVDSNLKLTYKNTDSSNTVELISNSNVILNQWNLASISYDGLKFYLFLNGVLQQSVPNPGGMSYADSTFIIGDSFKGYITQPLMNDICKYTEDFDFLLKAFSYKTNVYSDPTDTLAEYVRVKLSSTRLTYGLRDEVNNISFSSGLENKYFTPLSTNTRMLAYTKQEPKVALGNRDFCIELKVKFKSMTGYPRLICNNNNTWTTNCWTLDVNRTDSANLYSLHVYNIGNWTFNYPVILNELVDLALVREGVNLKYYVNGYLDKTINIGTGSFDDSTTSFIAMAYTMNINFYELRITTNHSRYTTTYEPKQLEWPDNELAFDQYKIINMPFKQYTSDNQSVFSFTNTNVSLSTDESLNGTKSAYFNNSKIVSNSKLLITNEKFTIEMFYKPKVESLTGVVSIVSILNSFRLGTKEGLLSFFNGTTWEDSTYLLDDKKFNHIVIQRTGSTIKLLADGNLVLTTTYTIPSGLKTITIGCFNDTEYVNGYVNNLIMYKNITKFQDQYTVPTEEIIVKPPVDLQPEVIVNQYTTSALDFENGLIDQIGTTVWNKQGTGNVTSVNKIFGDNSFETKALGDFLYTNSNIITGGATPFTIEFYALIKGGSDSSGYKSLLSKVYNGSYAGQGFSVTPSNRIQFQRQESSGTPLLTQEGRYNKYNNEIIKYTFTYDGSALRMFHNDKLDLVAGTSVGFYMGSDQPITFMSLLLPSAPVYNSTTFGLIDNINIFDGEARVVRDYDEHADKLVVDLAFDGENNSTKIVDNGTLKSSWLVYGTSKISTNQKFDGFSSLYLDGTGGIRSESQYVANTDTVTISFDIIQNRLNNNVYYDTYDGSYDGGFQLIHYNDTFGIWYSNIFESAGKTLTIGEKFNIVFTYENGFCKLYINGILCISKNLPLNFKNKYAIGGQLVYPNPNYYSDAYIKNFKIYKGVAVIAENPTGKIQLDFDKNLIDKYNNSTWTNNGVTFDQVNSVKGYAAYFNGSQSNKLLTNAVVPFNINDFKFSVDFKPTAFNFICTLFSAHGYLNLKYNVYLMIFQLTTGVNPNGDGTVNINFDRPINLLLNTTYKIEVIFKKDKCILLINDEVHQVISNLRELSNPLPTKYYIGSGMDSNTSITGYLDTFKSQVGVQDSEVVIDKPAVHLPLETNATNVGFTPLTVNSVGSPTYTTVDGKKCIKFESGKYLSINSNNIFNLGTSSDFYIEVDLYIISLNSFNNIIRNIGSWTTTSSAIQILSNGIVTLYAMDNKISSSSNSVILNTFNNLKVFRKGSITSITLNGVITEFNNLSFNFSDGGSQIGSVDVSPTSYINGYMSNFKMFVGTSEIPESYNDKKVLDLDFKPTRKSYLFKDKNNKCVIHPVNITQRDYQNSQYCCTFNGTTNQYLQLGKNDLFNFGHDDFIINIKFKTTGADDYNRILLSNAIPTTASNRAYIAITSTTNTVPRKIEFGITVGSTYLQISSNDEVVPNLDYDLIIISSNGMISMVLNGITQIITLSNVGVVDFNNGNNTYIGAVDISPSSTDRFKGTIYSIKVLRNTSDITLLDEESGEVIVDPRPIIDYSKRVYTVRFNFENNLNDIVTGIPLTMSTGVATYSTSITEEVSSSTSFDFGPTNVKRDMYVPAGPTLAPKFTLSGDFTLGFDINVKSTPTGSKFILSANPTGGDTRNTSIRLLVDSQNPDLYKLYLENDLDSSTRPTIYVSHPLLTFNKAVNIKFIRKGNYIRVYINNYFAGETAWTTTLNFNRYGIPLFGNYTIGNDYTPDMLFDTFFICDNYVETFHAVEYTA